jgi:tRNA threonylcarbamoyladenosine biosynthesis protein TsaE
MKKIIISHSPEETKKLGRKLAANLKAGDVISLIGELGTGKTVLSQGIAAGAGVRQNVTSASFVLIQKFQGKLPFYHLDFYRLSENEINESGFEEIFDSGGICVIEWAQKNSKILPVQTIMIKIKFLNSFSRQLIFEGRAGKLKGI